MASNEDREALESQIAAYEDRLRRRKVQQARYGYAADPAIENEIEDLELSIKSLKRQLDGSQLLPEARALQERFMADNIAFLMTTVEGMLRRQTTTEGETKRIAQEQHSIKEQVLRASDDIAKLFDHVAAEKRAGASGRKRNWRLMLFNTGLTIAAAVLLIGRAVGWW